MTVTRGGNNDQSIGSQMGDAARNAQGQAQSGEQRQAPRGSIFQLNSRLSRAVERRTTGETVAKYVKALQEDAKESFQVVGNPQAAEDYRFIILDCDQDQVALSAILVCYHQQVQSKMVIGVFTLPIEGSSSTPLREKRVDTIMNQKVENDITAGDVFDRIMWSRIENKVKAIYGGSPTVLNCGAMAIPVELSPENKEKIHEVFFSAAGALFTVVDVELGKTQAPFSASEVDRDAQKFAALDYNPQPVTNAVGLPVRSDLSINMTIQRNSGNQNDLHERSMLLGRVDGFVDLTYNAPDMIPTGYGQMTVGTQHYYPRFVITRVTNGVDAMTPELHLLAVSLSSMLWTNRAWMAAYLPRYDQPEDIRLMRDLGAVGYEINLTGNPQAPLQRIDTTSDSFTMQNRQELIQAVIRDRLIISMDVEERGELSWLAGMYVGAAQGNADSVRQLTQALDNLTSGNFSRIYNSRPNNGVLLRDDQNRIPLGYWKAKNGEFRDIRDFDYLAVESILGGVDPKAIVNWAATFDNLEIPMEMRCEQRSKMLHTLSHGSFRPKGWARRLTWSPEAMAALNEGCAAVGLVVSPKNISAEFATNGARAQYDAMGMAYQSSIGPQTMFAYANDMYRGYVGQAGPFFGRFGIG